MVMMMTMSDGDNDYNDDDNDDEDDANDDCDHDDDNDDNNDVRMMTKNILFLNFYLRLKGEVK